MDRKRRTLDNPGFYAIFKGFLIRLMTLPCSSVAVVEGWRRMDIIFLHPFRMKKMEKYCITQSDGSHK